MYNMCSFLVIRVDVSLSLITNHNSIILYVFYSHYDTRVSVLLVWAIVSSSLQTESFMWLYRLFARSCRMRRDRMRMRREPYDLSNPLGRKICAKSERRFIGWTLRRDAKDSTMAVRRQRPATPFSKLCMHFFTVMTWAGVKAIESPKQP